MKTRRRVKDLWLYTGVFLLLVAGITWYVYTAVPEYAQKNLPKIAGVKDFAFLNQDSQTITKKNITGKIAVVNFFFTTCEGICPKMNHNMKKIYDIFQADSNIVLLSHTVDPETDNVRQLKEYADSLGIKNREGKAQWHFLTGDKLALYKQARESYTLDDPKNNVGSIEDQFLHTQFVALVDKAGVVRKIYDGLIVQELEELRQDIQEMSDGKYAY